MPNCEQIAVKNTKRLIFSRSPAGQEEKTGLARFPLAVLSTASHPTNTLPCGTAKARTRGTGRCRSEALRKNLFHKQKKPPGFPNGWLFFLFQERPIIFRCNDFISRTWIRTGKCFRLAAPCLSFPFELECM